MIRNLLAILFLGVVLSSCGPKENLQTTTISARSMVCDKCAAHIKQAVYDVEGVKEVDVDVKAKTVVVKFVPLQTNVETIEQAITEAGYDANNKKRNPDAYEKLEPCCKIDG